MLRDQISLLGNHLLFIIDKGAVIASSLRYSAQESDLKPVLVVWIVSKEIIAIKIQVKILILLKARLLTEPWHRSIVHPSI